MSKLKVILEKLTSSKWAYVLAFLNIVDAIETAFAVSMGATELNPLMALLISKHIGLFLLVKFVFSGIILWKLRKPSLVAIIPVLLYLFVTGSNLVVIYRLLTH